MSARIEVFDSLTAAEQTWRRFETDGTALPYQRFDWVDTWAATIADARSVQPCPVALHSPDGEPLLFLPLGVRSGSFRGRDARVLTWLADSISDQLAPILGPGADRLDAEQIAGLWEQVLEETPSADHLAIELLPETVYGRHNPLCQLAGLHQHAKAHFTRLADDWDTYFKSKAKSTRRGDSRRQLRRLGEQGEVELRTVTDPDEFHHVVETMIAQKRRRYDETGRDDLFADSSFGDFYHSLTDRHPDLLQLSVLTVGDEVIATDWSATGRGTLHGLMTTHEGGDWRQYSPGRLLLEWVLAGCCATGIGVFDFSTGDEPYKKEWCEDSVDLYRLDRPLSTRARLEAVPRRVKRRLAATAPGQAIRNRVAATGPEAQGMRG